jgi:RHS repeat-associated protein
MAAYFHADGLGSIIRMTNAAGAVTVTRGYDAWGNPELGVGEPGFAFTGREWDPETGLHYYRARYYDPRLGRFLSEDPIRLRGGFNLYRYVYNKPTRFTDPHGLCGEPESCYYQSYVCWGSSCMCQICWYRAKACPTDNENDKAVICVWVTRHGCASPTDQSPDPDTEGPTWDPAPPGGGEPDVYEFEADVPKVDLDETGRARPPSVRNPQ